MQQKYKSNSEKDTNINFSSGNLSRLSNGSITIESGSTSLIVNSTVSNKLEEDFSDIVPLVVDYRERYSASGKFPGGYIKREGRLNDREVLVSRLCDRSIRPLFLKNFHKEVQIIGLLMSSDQITNPDILFVNGASASLMVSNIPWNGPIGCVRIGYLENNFIVNPSFLQLKKSSINLVYAGNKNGVVMIEGYSNQISRDFFIDSLKFAQKKIQSIINAQIELKQLVNINKQEIIIPEFSKLVYKIAKSICKKTFDRKFFRQSECIKNNIIKRNREKIFVTCLKKKVFSNIISEGNNFNSVNNLINNNQHLKSFINNCINKILKKSYRKYLIRNKIRIDNRNFDEIRKINSKVQCFSKVHGSSFFQRGNSQVIVTTTLGSNRDSQSVDSIFSEKKSLKSFFLHYNFYPFSVGETGRKMLSRREIGHGMLAEQSLRPVMPSEEEFGYTIRLLSDVLESNGSTSMATVCGSSLSLMDAGVPIKYPVAGISIGLILTKKLNKNFKSEETENNYILLTDILGSEDFYGDMDFKVAGTKNGITGFQLDLKINGIPIKIINHALKKSSIARNKILEEMKKTISKPRKNINENAPKIKKIKINHDRIGFLIGPGGKNINRIIDLTGVQIEIKDKNEYGEVIIFSKNHKSVSKAKKEVLLLTSKIEEGKIYKGIVKKIKNFGVFVECLPGQEGMVHISDLSNFKINRVEDICRVGDEMIVKCINIDHYGRVKLSRKIVLSEIKKNSLY
jgi:polyribonucleotide nucleotidyltransferase